MKQCLFIIGIILAVMLPSCSSQNSECIDKIASIINIGATQDSFIRPGGNAFANDEIKAIIKENMDYKLTDADKQKLTAAINILMPDVSAQKYESNTTAGEMLVDLKMAERKQNLANINAAKTLGDLL